MRADGYPKAPGAKGCETYKQQAPHPPPLHDASRNAPQTGESARNLILDCGGSEVTEVWGIYRAATRKIELTNKIICKENPIAAN